MKTKHNLWHKTANFFEFGDLVPFAVVVSAYHFVVTLLRFGEAWPVAIMQGIFVDLLHFRTVRRAVKERTKTAWAIAAMTTAISFAFHWLFYVTHYSAGGVVVYEVTAVSFLLAAPLPLGIPILAWHQQNTANQSARSFWHRRIKAVVRLARKLQAANSQLQIGNNTLQTANNDLQTNNNHLQNQITQLQNRLDQLQADADAWQTLNREAQTLARFNAGLIDEMQAASLIGVKDTRTVYSRAEKLNGVAK